MKIIPLYDVKPLTNIPSDITRRHWQDEAVLTEELLADFLGLEDGADVLLLDRATHALELAIGTGSWNYVSIPNRTYRAAVDAVDWGQQMAVYEDRVQFVEPDLDHSLPVPTTLGGTNPLYLRVPHPYVYDCAHTCYRGMFAGWQPTEEQFAVLSFYPTKPLGALGGGALIGHKTPLADMRPLAWPIDQNELCSFDYPQSVQSWAVRQRIAEWDEEYWREQRLLWARTADWVLDNYDLEFAWPQPGAVIVTPHLLAFRGPGVDALRRHCNEAAIETGRHYPPLDEEDSDAPEHITIPFHTEEVIERLSA